MSKGVLSPTRVKTLAVALGLLAHSCSIFAQQPISAEPHTSRLDLQLVLANLEEKNRQRAAALIQFDSTRIYKMQYRGFPSDRDADMVVQVRFHAPTSKEFTVVSQSGSKFVIDRVFKKLLEGEQEASNGDNRQDTALTRQNYDFEMAGFESTPDGGAYVLNLSPKTKNKFLYRGKIWVDANDFAVTRIEGEPAKNPSFWIKKTAIAHRYKKVDGFWLPAENHTDSFIRLGGKATLSIEYRDYKVVKANSAATGRKRRQPGDSSLDGIVANDGTSWAPQLLRSATQ